MSLICITTSCPSASAVHRRLDEIAARVPCIAKYFSDVGEIYIECRAEDIAFIKRMIADLD